MTQEIALSTQDLQVRERLAERLAGFVKTAPTKITNEQEFQASNTWLVGGVKERKEIEGFYKIPLDRLKEQKKRLTADKIDLLKDLAATEERVRKLNGEFYRKQQEANRKKQEVYNRKFDEKVNKAIEAGKDVSTVGGPKMVDMLDKTTQTEAGKVSYREVKTVVILDESQIPERFWTRVRNDKLIKACALAGETIPGVQVVKEIESAVYGAK